MRSTEDYPPNLYTDTIIHKAAYSSCKTISPVVKQFHACNKSDHLQLRPEPPLCSNFCVALTMWHHRIFLVCCSVKLVSKSFLILGYMWKDHFVTENIQMNIHLINFNIFLPWYVLQMTKSCSDRLMISWTVSWKLPSVIQSLINSLRQGRRREFMFPSVSECRLHQILTDFRHCMGRLW